MKKNFMTVNSSKYIISVAILLLLGSFSVGGMVNAQGMMYWNTPTASSSDTAEEEARGKIIYDSLQAKTRACNDLADSDFELMGEYFMGLQLGESHASMNSMMKRMLGEDGEEQMHVAMGKSLSGCDTTAVWPQSSFGFMPMFGMMGSWSNYNDFNKLNTNNMMNFGYSPYGFGFLGPIMMIVFWGLIIFAIVAMIRWGMGRSGHGPDVRGDSALDILKGRYAKGEIDKKEFEEKKKDLL